MYEWKDLKKKWRIPNGRTQLKPKKRKYPTYKLDEARAVLTQHNRDLGRCQECGKSTKIQIHHRDKNPYNNSIENLDVLCNRCHMRRHHLPFGVIDEFEGIPYAE